MDSVEEERLDVVPEQVPEDDDVYDDSHQSDGEHQKSADDSEDREDDSEVPPELPALEETEGYDDVDQSDDGDSSASDGSGSSFAAYSASRERQSAEGQHHDSKQGVQCTDYGDEQRTTCHADVIGFKIYKVRVPRRGPFECGCSVPEVRLLDRDVELLLERGG